MVEYLLVSLTEGYFLKISNEEAKYTEDYVKSSALLYKLLTKKAIVDTRATTSQFCSSLDNFQNYMGTINSNIELFNLHVKNSKEGLTARCKPVNGLLLKKIESYKATANTNFLEDMEKKKEAYLEGKNFDSDKII